MDEILHYTLLYSWLQHFWDTSWWLTWQLLTMYEETAVWTCPYHCQQVTCDLFQMVPECQSNSCQSVFNNEGQLSGHVLPEQMSLWNFSNVHGEFGILPLEFGQNIGNSYDNINVQFPVVVKSNFRAKPILHCHFPPQLDIEDFIVALF